MDFIYDSVTYELPDSLEEILLSQHITWTTTYGAALDAQQVVIKAIEDEATRNIAASLLVVERICKAISFYTTIPLEEVQNDIPIEDVKEAYALSEINLAVDRFGGWDEEIEILEEYEFDGDTWVLHTPSTSVGDPITEEDYQNTTRLADIYLTVLEGNWSDMKVLCAAYLRKEAEAFTSALILDGSARIDQMADLPMNIALAVYQNLKNNAQEFADVINQYASESIPEEMVDLDIFS